MCTSRSLEEVDFWSRVTKQSEAVANVFSYPAVGVNLERKGRSGHWEEMMGHFNRCWVRFLMPGSGIVLSVASKSPLAGLLDLNTKST